MGSAERSAVAVCSLDPDAMARRAGDFRALLAPGLLALRRVGDGAELDLSLDAPGERSLARLLDLERRCCPFWRFSLTRRSRARVTLGVRAVPPHEDALEAFLTLARPQSSRHSEQVG